MSVKEHQQGPYKSYRCVRSVDGYLRQKYFPRTPAGLKAAKALDEQWAKEQKAAQLKMHGARARWNPTIKHPHSRAVV